MGGRTFSQDPSKWGKSHHHHQVDTTEEGAADGIVVESTVTSAVSSNQCKSMPLA